MTANYYCLDENYGSCGHNQNLLSEYLYKKECRVLKKMEEIYITSYIPTF